MRIWLSKRSYESVTFNVLESMAAPAIIGFECERPTLTLGKRSADVKNETLAANDVHTVLVDRGGQATLHNPGQLVIYPKVDLNTLNMGVRDFVCCLEKAVISALSTYGLKLHREDSGPGLYTNQGKVVFIGLRIKRGVVHHGLSINVSNELSDFQNIRSCGQWGAPVGSLGSHGVHVSLEEVFEAFCEAFQELVNLTPQAASSTLAAPRV